MRKLDIDKEAMARIAKLVLKQAGAARRNPSKFYSFVLREETTRARIKTLPHQELVFKFVMHYSRCVIRMPVGFSKTYLMAALSMYLMGQDCTTRGAIISATQGQARKPLALVRDYIETSKELKLVFPKLRRSNQSADPWTQSAITVERPTGIRDASLTAVGYDGALPGARLNWILVDDILTDSNTATEEQRQGIDRWLLNTVMARRDAENARMVVCNTPWHPEDATYQLEKRGWPTLTIDAYGNIFFSNTCEHDLMPGCTLSPEGEFDCDDIRPSEMDPEGKAHRLTAHDSPVYNPALQHLSVKARATAEPWVDENDEIPTWPERYGTQKLRELELEYSDAPHEFGQLYRMKCRDDESARVKVAYIDACKKRARDLGFFTFISEWREGRTFTGVDLGVGRKKGNDRSSIFTFGLMPQDKSRLLLRLESGRWSGKAVIEKLIEHRDAYNSVIRVETNAAQDFLRQWALDVDRSLPIRASITGANKHNRQHGVESVFVEFENHSWIIPNDPTGKLDEAVKRWIDAMLFYDPTKHTGDELMACWLARLEASERGLLRKPRNSRGIIPPVTTR